MLVRYRKKAELCSEACDVEVALVTPLLEVPGVSCLLSTTSQKSKCVCVCDSAYSVRMKRSGTDTMPAD